MNFDKLRVSQRLYLGFGLLLAILVAVTVLALLKVSAIEAALVSNTDEHANETAP